jgi:DNA-binding XRE family transcriptional regulator
MFREARNRAGISRDEAAFRLHIGTRTLNNYEHGITITPPEIALKMQEVYQDPTLTAKYCSDYCPIGQIFAHQVPEHNNLCQSVLGLLDEHSDVAELRATLTKISADGVIDEHEIPVFKSIMEELLELEMKIEELKLQAALMINLPELMQKKRKPLALAAR